MNHTGSTTLLDGVFVPMFTPFSSDASAVDEDQLRANVRFLIEAGVRLLNPVGTTGEFWTLTPDEHRQVIRSVIEEVAEIGSDALVIPGTTSHNLAQALDLAEFAVGCGATMIQLAPPYYLPLSERDLIAYYQTFSERIDAGIMVYEIPPATGVQFPCSLMERICDVCPRVIALKTATPAYAPRELERLVHRLSQRLSIFSATGVYYSPFTYLTGVAGITDTLANVVPTFGLQLHRLARATRWDDLNRLYQGAFDVLEIELIYGRAGLKYMAEARGMSSGPTRYPMQDPLTGAARQDIADRLDRWSFLHDPSGNGDDIILTPDSIAT